MQVYAVAFILVQLPPFWHGFVSQGRANIKFVILSLFLCYYKVTIPSVVVEEICEDEVTVVEAVVEVVELTIGHAVVIIGIRYHSFHNDCHNNRGDKHKLYCLGMEIHSEDMQYAGNICRRIPLHKRSSYLSWFHY